MDFGNSSRPTMTVAPVVVSAEIDSKTASTKDICSSCENMNGVEPDMPKTVQNKTTTKNPSLKRSSRLMSLTGNHKITPTKKTIIKLLIKGANE